MGLDSPELTRVQSFTNCEPHFLCLTCRQFSYLNIHRPNCKFIGILAFTPIIPLEHFPYRTFSLKIPPACICIIVYIYGLYRLVLMCISPTVVLRKGAL